MKRYQSWMIAALGLSLSGCGLFGGGKDGENGGKDEPKEEIPSVGDRVCTGAKVGAPVLRRLTATETENTLRDLFPEIGGAWTGVKLGPDPLSHLNFSNDSEALQVGNQVAEQLLKTAENVADLLTAQGTLSSLLPCASSTPDENCAGTFVDKYGTRLYRRPLGGDERAELVELFNSVKGQTDFTTGMKWMIVSMIQAPQAFYRSEIGAAKDGRYELSQYEIATELAYTYGGTTPSQELLDKAGAGALNSEEVLSNEARALLQTPRGREAFHRFAREWIIYTKVQGKAKTNVADFVPVGDQMIEETKRFIDEVVYNRQGGLRELLTAPYTVMSSKLSSHYKYGNVSGDFQLVDRPPEWGVGLLAQGSILAGRAQMDSSSPTLRGLLVFERFLCGEVPPPPANIPPVTPPEQGKITTRQRWENNHVKAGCDSCHKQFDPTGFALEHFDEAGRYRADEGGLPIDASGYLWMGDDAETKVPVDGMQNLAETLVNTPEVAECVGNLTAVYAYGGAAGAECGIDTVREGLKHEEFGLLEYFARLAATEHIRYRETQ